ncbi:hypothetical protein B0H12DRAFT_1070704 [Mycena haematopus]|nr:hypothetical protein B0H12DRAFT_1070704 [Mycena haematopus]
MWWPRLKLPFGSKQQFLFGHSFLIFDLPEEKYGHHTALVWHSPKMAHYKVVARFGRFEKEIAEAELLGEIRMSRPYSMDRLEKDADSVQRMYGCAEGRDLFDALKTHRKELRGEDVGTVGVYLVEVMTRRADLLFNGNKSSLPSGYLTSEDGILAKRRSLFFHRTKIF